MSRFLHPWRRPVPADLPPVVVPGTVRAGLLADVEDPIATPKPAPAPEPEPAPAATLGPTYTITYDRVGQWGRVDGCPAPAPLTITAATRSQIEDAIGRDVVSYLPARAEVRVTVDLRLMAGMLRIGDRGVGTFDLRMHGEGGSR
jgi:hypothetical protein